MTYQIYDFKKEVDIHINKKVKISLPDKSISFKKYLFNLKLFQLDKKIPKNHDIFNENYFLFINNHVLYVAKRIESNVLLDDKFDYIEIKNGIKIIRKLKLKNIFS